VTQNRDIDQGEQGQDRDEAAQMDMTGTPDNLVMNVAEEGGDQENEEATPTDVSRVPEHLAVDGEEAVPQSRILEEIIGTTLVNAWRVDEFNDQQVKILKLSQLKRFYEEDDQTVVNQLSWRHQIEIDKEFMVPVGTGKLRMNTDVTMLDYQLTVGRCIGFSPLLPNVAGAHLFGFMMDLKKPYKDFKGKNAMVGFDPKGRMLYIGHATNEDIYLAMAPNEFISGDYEACRPGHSTGSSMMSRRHYRQVVMMLTHFLEGLPERSYMNTQSVYKQDLDSPEAKFELITNAL
jgi:hypothetical protein